MATLRGLTFDTGALIALERRKVGMRLIWRAALHARVEITIPTVVLVEWWRGKGGNEGPTSSVLASVTVEPLDERLAKRACELLGQARAASAVDAVVVASAEQRGDVIYTGDLDDLRALARGARGVRV